MIIGWGFCEEFSEILVESFNNGNFRFKNFGHFFASFSCESRFIILTCFASRIITVFASVIIAAFASIF